MRIRLRSVGIFVLLTGAVIYTIGILLTPAPPVFIYENVTRRKVFNPIWPHSAPELNPVATIGYEIFILGAVLAIIGILKPRSRKKAQMNL